MDDLRRLVDAVDADGPIEVRWPLPPPEGTKSGRVGLLPGSFNPPTAAHTALAAAGRAVGLATVVYLLSKRTVNKEQVTGLQLHERLHLLCEVAGPDHDAVAFLNRGLYVELAAAMRDVLPPAAELVFLTGYDKIVQIFDPKYYQDRDSALRELFGLASFLVAPREGADDDELAALMAEPANRQFSDRVSALPLDARYREVSSTRARAGREPELPEVVRSYLDHRRPYA